MNGGSIYGGVLAGGASRRMGSTKALLRLEGRSFLARVANALEPAVERVVILGAGDDPLDQRGWLRLADSQGPAGPLAGMLAAFDWAPQAAWVFAACDLPLLTREAVDWLLGERRADHWAVLPRLQGPIEPLFALYEPGARARLKELASSGDLSLQRLASLPGVRTPTPPPALWPAWRNVNTPEEWRALATGEN